MRKTSNPPPKLVAAPSSQSLPTSPSRTRAAGCGVRDEQTLGDLRCAYQGEDLHEAPEGEEDGEQHVDWSVRLSATRLSWVGDVDRFVPRLTVRKQYMIVIVIERLGGMELKLELLRLGELTALRLVADDMTVDGGSNGTWTRTQEALRLRRGSAPIACPRPAEALGDLGCRTR